MWTIIGQRTVIVIVDIAGRRCCQGYHRVGIGRPVDVKGLLQSVDDGGRAKWKGAGVVKHFTFFDFFWCFVATQLARQLHQGRLQVVCSNKEARKRLAGRHSRNGPWSHECCFEVDVFVCWEWSVELEWLLLLRICLSFFLRLGFPKPHSITSPTL